MECLDHVKLNFKDYFIIAYVTKVNSEFLWKLIDYELIDAYKDAQHSLVLKNKLIHAEDHDFKSIYIYDIEKGYDYFTSTDNLEDKNYKVLANRGRVRSAPIWRLVDTSLQDKYFGTLLTLKFREETYNALDYRENVVALKHKFTKDLLLIHCDSRKIAMKKS